MQTTTHATLPQTGDGWVLTDGGIETTLIFQDGIDLPEFAAFVLLESSAGTQTLRRYYERYLEIAAASPGAGFVLESPTWRAGFDWCKKLGYDEAAMARFNRAGMELMHELRAAWAPRISGALVVSGCIGPRGDGYKPGEPMTGDDAMQAHLPQARALAAAGCDMLSAITMTTSGEAIGVARAAALLGKPCAISFTVETDGRLPSGESLRAAIEATDREAGIAPAYYMINCAHPTHFESVLADGGADGGLNAAWTQRIGGLRANASCLSHAELDVMTELDDGDPEDLAGRYVRLRTPLPKLKVLGGCCGTDHRHVAALSAAWQRA